MKFEEYEHIKAELWHTSLILYHHGIDVGDEVSRIDFNLSMNYETEEKEHYSLIIEKFKSMLTQPFENNSV